MSCREKWFVQFSFCSNQKSTNHLKKLYIPKTLNFFFNQEYIDQKYKISNSCCFNESLCQKRKEDPLLPIYLFSKGLLYCTLLLHIFGENHSLTSCSKPIFLWEVWFNKHARSQPQHNENNFHTMCARKIAVCFSSRNSDRIFSRFL